MRVIENICQSWQFTKDENTMNTLRQQTEFETVSLPHTWNNLDGQDGGMDYYRGVCWYKKEIKFSSNLKEKEVYLEFQGVHSIAEVYVNQVKVARHEGGFSTFRVNITSEILWDSFNEIAVSVDNRQNDFVYPQMADFTFFGGIYRKVQLIYVEKRHFELDNHGDQGIQVTASMSGNRAEIHVHTPVHQDKEELSVEYVLRSMEGMELEKRTASAEEGKTTFQIQDPVLWQGTVNPYLYEMKALLKSKEEVLDEVSTPFGIRTFKVDPDQGFMLNGEAYALRGVSRHQDRENLGWAISEKEHEEDMVYIKEMGANTIRLAHYQHDAYFYDLCDRYGMVVWAEIPMISSFMENAYENTMLQMRELILQNINHPSICFWGISNEISMGGESEALDKNLKDLNELAHALDPTRLTTIANASMTKFDSSHNHITDVVAYNHYYGWYGGEVKDNEKWFDAFHRENPNIPIGLSEYGAECILKYHTDTPKIRDYSEEYQTLYHEKMLEMMDKRPYIWSTYVWNMFDFAADARDEGGEMGRNHKGLMTYDRTIKKDAYFIYKAYWSKEPFVHICGRRFVERASETVTVKVYSNGTEVELFVNEDEPIRLKGQKVFEFKGVNLKRGENTLRACMCSNGEKGAEDQITLQRVETENPSYEFKEEFEGEGADNWFVERSDGTVGFFQFPEGYLSVNDTIEDIMRTQAGEDFMMHIISQTPVQGNQKELLDYLKGYSIKGLLKLTSGKGATPERLLLINEQLNKIPKAKH